MLRDQASFDVVLGIFDFQKHVGDWEFVDVRGFPFVRIRHLERKSIDGIIGNFYEGPWIDALTAAGIATVNTSTQMAESPFARVGNDDDMTGRLGAEHLLEKGFAHLGFIQRERAWSSQRRFEAFRTTTRAAGRLCHSLTVPYDHTLREGLIFDWLRHLPKPIGIMAAVDGLAYHAIELAKKLGLRVPDDVAVIGVDNNRWMTELSDPPISSITRDDYQIGYLAAKTLDRLMAGDPVPPPRWVPPLGVISRRSTDVVLVNDPMVAKALDCIRNSVGEGITVEDVLAEVGASRRSLERRMKQAIGKTPQAAIAQAQVERAEEMLVNSDLRMYEIADACGFSRLARFFNVFKRQTGLTPGQYRRRGAGELGEGHPIDGEPPE